ncbi:MAG: hypothetical protein LBF83_07410 [Spirochaetaceae bacterium]|nr:hypothetical protein [Spirochaetaceae bacterium]
MAETDGSITIGISFNLDELIDYCVGFGSLSFLASAAARLAIQQRRIMNNTAYIPQMMKTMTLYSVVLNGALRIRTVLGFSSFQSLIASSLALSPLSDEPSKINSSFGTLNISFTFAAETSSGVGKIVSPTANRIINGRKSIAPVLNSFKTFLFTIVLSAILRKK